MPVTSRCHVSSDPFAWPINTSTTACVTRRSPWTLARATTARTEARTRRRCRRCCPRRAPATASSGAWACMRRRGRTWRAWWSSCRTKARVRMLAYLLGGRGACASACAWTDGWLPHGRVGVWRPGADSMLSSSMQLWCIIGRTVCKWAEARVHGCLRAGTLLLMHACMPLNPHLSRVGPCRRGSGVCAAAGGQGAAHQCCRRPGPAGPAG